MSNLRKCHKGLGLLVFLIQRLIFFSKFHSRGTINFSHHEVVWKIASSAISLKNLVISVGDYQISNRRTNHARVGTRGMHQPVFVDCNLTPSWCIYTFVCLTSSDGKYIRVKETDSVKLDNKKTSVFFALMYFLSAPVRQTEV